VFETLREDEEFAFCRGRRDDGELPTILLVASAGKLAGLFAGGTVSLYDVSQSDIGHPALNKLRSLPQP
jgi:hypothetical protein